MDKRMLTAAATALWIAAAGAPAQGPDAARPAGRDLGAETVTKITAPFTVAAVGDIFEPQPLYSDAAGFQSLIGVMRAADVGFANMESSLVDLRDFHGPVAGSLAPLEMGASMRAMGITLVNHANNQALDGGLTAMVSTDEALDRLGIVHAGTGRDLQQARAAQFLETPKGRVGLVGMFSMDDSSNYGPNFTFSAATYRNGDLGGAPGVNALHLTAYHIVSPDELQALARIAGNAYGGGAANGSGAQRIKFYDEWYQAGSDGGGMHYEMNAGDERDILQSVRNGKVYADFLIVTIHSHQTSNYQALGWGGVDHTPPDFLVKLAHESIDNGADMFIAHGVHALRGIEIYRGKPIFYGLSSFVFQFGLQPGPSYDVLGNERGMAILESPPNQESVLTTSRFEHGQLVEVRLYPVDLGGASRPISQMGIPLSPSASEARRILEELRELSAAFGTRVVIDGNVGVIRLDPSRQGAGERSEVSR